MRNNPEKTCGTCTKLRQTIARQGGMVCGANLSFGVRVAESRCLDETLYERKKHQKSYLMKDTLQI